MQLELTGPGPEEAPRAAARRAEIRISAYQDAKPTSLSPIAAGSSQPPKFIRDIAAHNQIVWQVDNELRVLEEMPVGAELAGRLFALRGRELGCDGAVRVTALWQKVAAWATAESMVSTREAIDSDDWYIKSQELRAPVVIGQEIACLTHTSMAAAMAHVTLTQQVADCMPASWVALDHGDWSLTHVRTLAYVLQNATPRVTQLVEARIVPAALKYGWTPAQVKKYAQRELIALDPEGAAERAREAKTNADVTFAGCPDETATVTGYGDAATTRRIFDTINAKAASMARGGDERSVGQRRFDALAKAVLGEASKRPAAQALIEIPLGTLLGSDDPAELAGYGPITAETARRLATDAIWRKLITDPGTGEALDLGMKSYRPTDQLLRFVKARDWTCTFLGCNQPAVVCDCDHRLDHHKGGPTNPRNLQMLCRLHHNLKTCKLWSSLIDETGQIKWTSPLGHSYTVEPHRLLELLDEPPEEPAEPIIPVHAVDEPDPPWLGEAWPEEAWPDEPPPITIEQLEEYLDLLDTDQLDEWFQANESYDQLRLSGAIA